jgi:DNA polymerase
VEDCDIHIDFETYSLIDLPDSGAYVYAQHHSTGIHCMAWYVRGTPFNGLWVPGETIPPALLARIRFARIHAWNAQFERLIWEHKMPKDWPAPTFNQWRCTAALARSCGLPGKLSDAAKMMQLSVQKSDTRLMKKLSNAAYRPSVSELDDLGSYCENDVIVESEIVEELGEMSDNELYIYQINERINDRGVRVDWHFAAKAVALLAEETNRLNARLTHITGGQITKATQVAQLKKWIEEQTGWLIASLDKHAIQDLQLSNPDIFATGPVGEALSIRKNTAKSSTAKYMKILDRAGYNDPSGWADNEDERIRGMFVHAGAGQTGRFSSVGVQLHNLVRDVPSDAEEIIAAVKQGMTAKQIRLIWGDLIPVFSTLLRPTLIPAPGKIFVTADYKGVEARGLPWLAEDDDEIAAYAADTDRYVEDAQKIFKCSVDEVTPLRRQIGKVVRLACGFGGGAGALQAMARGYDLKFNDDNEAYEIASAWHDTNRWAKAFGKRLEDAARIAMVTPNVPIVVEHARGIAYLYAPALAGGKGELLCKLPSGRVIHYYRARMDESKVMYSFKPSTGLEEALWQGVLAENVTQAVCNDLLRYGMVLLTAGKYKIVAHVHDEFVLEVDDPGDDPVALEGLRSALTALLQEVPEWAKGRNEADAFPLVCQPEFKRRYI